MTFPNIIEDINDLQDFVKNIGQNIINLIYPVGSIYMSVNNVSPAIFLGGTWESIEDTFLLCSGSNHSAGSTGGEETHTLSVAETPSHTHTRGTMDIVGSFGCDRFNSTNGNAFVWGWDGAFSGKNISGAFAAFNADASQTTTWRSVFQASRNWTGETSSVGSSQSHNNMPPYLTVYCWKRID